jgi:hypothetical protein
LAESVRASVTKAVENKPQSTVEKWKGVIESYDREFKKWDARTDKLLKKYRDENRISRDNNARFNILWANVNTLVPAVFAKLPKPDVSRRFRDSDPDGRVAALILERGLEYETEHYPDYYATMRQCVYDRFLGGRGTAWVRYEPHMRAAAKAQPVDGEEVTDDIDEPGEELDYECAPVDYVHWKDFGHTVARTWEEVSQVWRWVYMKMPAKVERFGEELAAKIPKDAPPKEGRNKQDMGADPEQEDGSFICELWDKDTKKAYWFSKSYPDILDEKDDPLGLEEFFPCPKPLFSTLTNESLVPVPDFTMYQDQARELDTLCDRIDGLINALQVKGVYDAAEPALARIFTEGQNGNLIPVKNWAAFAEKNGLAGAIDIVDLKPIYEALKAAYEAMAQVLNQIYDLTGLSDIIRGQSEANETATAQKIKGQYASLRLKFLQFDVARFASELLQLKAQVICGQFEPKTIALISGVSQLADVDKPRAPAAMALLIGPERMIDPNADAGENPMRAFRIEVNADTMVQMDEDAEKQARIEFITAQGTFMKKALPMAQASPQVLPLIGALWKFSVGAFKVGKALEGEFDAVIDAAKQEAMKPQPPKPDPEMARVQAQAQADQMRSQNEQQNNAAKLQFEQQKSQMQAALDTRLKELELTFEKWKVEYEGRIKLEIAEIAAKGTLQAAQMSAAASGADLELDGEVKGKVKDGPMAKAAQQVSENAQKVADMHGELKGALDAHRQMLEGQAQKQAAPQERMITMPSGRKYIRRDNGNQTQILPVQ